MADPSRPGGGDGRARPRTNPGRPYQVSERTTRGQPAPSATAAAASEDVVATDIHRAIEAERIALRAVAPEPLRRAGGGPRDRVEQEAAAAAGAHHARAAP